MIRQKVLGMSLVRRAQRRRFVIAFWAVEAMALALLFQFPLPPRQWQEFVPLLILLAAANNLPLLLGGFSVGGAVSFYEGRHYRLQNAAAEKLARNPERFRRVQKFIDAMRPVDEREAQLRDWAYYRAHRLIFWAMYAGAVAFLAMSAISLAALARFGFVLLDFLLVASLSLPQTLILWNEQEAPDFETGALAADGGGQ
jgi:hypothetical protein